VTSLQIALTIIGSVVGIIGLVIVVSKTVIEMVWKPKVDDLTALVVRTETKNRELIAELTVHRQDSEQRRLTAFTAEEKKASVERRLQFTMEAMNATGASVFVPEPSRVSSNFVFLSVLGPVADKIRLMRFPIKKGIVGSVYATGHVLNTDNAHKDPRWSNIMDEISKFETQSLVCAPIILDGASIGVVQFLNKLEGQQFSSTDEETAVQFASSIVLSVDDFVRNNENFQRIGISPERDEKDAIIAFIDLTASKLMFDILPPSVYVDRINEYLERQCEIALRHGAVVDKYLGDGAMIRFMNSDVLNAVVACQTMKSDFEQMKEGWCKFNDRMSAVHSRVGLSYGPVQEVNLGHPQFKQITVMGNVVNKASMLCDHAVRNRSVILTDNSTCETAECKITTKQYVETNIKGLAGVCEVVSPPRVI
jgi:class 3 adenylate cyclase